MGKRSSLSVDVEDDAVPAKPPTKPFDDLEELRSVDGVIGIISQHRSNGMLTFTVLREFEQFGQMKRTGFFPETMIPSYQKMVGMVIEKIGELQAKLGPQDQRGRAHRGG